MMRNQSTSYWKLHRVPLLIVLVSILFYIAFAYNLIREDFLKLLGLYAALFFFCFKLIQFEKWNFKFLLAAGVLFRLVFLMASPNLSQDFYRFIWDGQLVVNGVNPYLYTPDELMAQTDFFLNNSQYLHTQMGTLSAKNFSNYPPLNQLLFALATLLGGKTIIGSVVIMRITVILADLGVFYFGRKLLKLVNRSPHLIFWYFLNPLVIIELTGNLHFEGVMLFFFLWALYLIANKRWIWGALVLGCSISVKLIPLLFLPLFFKHFEFKKSVLFYLLVAVSVILSVLPFYSPQFLDHYMATVGLWFSNFEFNAGIYNLIKKIAVQMDAKPWELVKTYGKITPVVIIVLALVLTFFRNNKKMVVLLGSMLWLLSSYYFLAATVHPWYLIFLVLLCIYTDYRFPLVWSAVVILSYSAYSNPDKAENLGLLFVEYLIVFGFLLYEIIRMKAFKFEIQKN